MKKIDIEDIKSMLGEMSYDLAKIAINGNNLLKREDISLPVQLVDEQKEKHFGSKYRIHEKPTIEDLKAEFDEEEWTKAIELIKEPQKNQFVPDDISTIVKPAKRKNRNNVPKEIEIAKGVNLYH